MNAFQDIIDRMAFCTHVGVGAFADNDGVVDDDTEDQDKTEQGNGINRHAQCIGEKNRSEERNGYPHTYPERNTGPQERGQNDQHQQKTCAGAAEQRIEPVR